MKKEDFEVKQFCKKSTFYDITHEEINKLINKYIKIVGKEMIKLLEQHGVGLPLELAEKEIIFYVIEPIVYYFSDIPREVKDIEAQSLRIYSDGDMTVILSCPNRHEGFHVGQFLSAPSCFNIDNFKEYLDKLSDDYIEFANRLRKVMYAYIEAKVKLLDIIDKSKLMLEVKKLVFKEKLVK